MTIDKQALLGADKHVNQHRLSRLIIEANSAELRAIAEAVEQYTDQLIAALADSEKHIAELESKNGNLRTIAHEQNELAIRANLDGNNATVEMGRLHKRIAELEARELTLPPRAPENLVSVLDGYEKWLIATTFRDTWNACLAEVMRMNAAGIGVKQQQDGVDSDAGSRNQPGMVVAIHIDAGDFVKVKGEVFEVEETDFDDHDVTLWFVGGNALKCSAGCLVEVVSAPVAADIKVKG